MRKQLKEGDVFVCINNLQVHPLIGEGTAFFDGKDYTAGDCNNLIDERGVSHTFDESLFDDFFIKLNQQ